MTEEVKKKGMFSRLFKGSVYEEPDEESIESPDKPSEEVGPADEKTPEEIASEITEETVEEKPVAAQPVSEVQPEVQVEVEPAEQAEEQPAWQAEGVTTPAQEPEEAADTTIEDALEQPPEEERKKGLFGRLRNGLSKTRGSLVGKIDKALFGKKVVDEETLEELEEALVTADIGVNTTMRLVQEVAERVSRRELTDPEALRQHLKKRIGEILLEDEGHFTLGEVRPYVVLVIGVNGVGKTTTIAKLAARYIGEGHKVIIGAADTFRAAAIEQLCTWGERVGAKVVHHQHGSDPAAVAYDTLEAAKARGADLVLIDTAGRLHTKINLMEEMKKIRRVVGNSVEGAPHEVMLVLDSTTGQNAINQAIQFRDTVGVDSIALTKLDGTAKGGVIVGICDELKIPVKFIGIGEQVDDLRPFEAEQFIEALF